MCDYVEFRTLIRPFATIRSDTLTGDTGAPHYIGHLMMRKLELIEHTRLHRGRYARRDISSYFGSNRKPWVT